MSAVLTAPASELRASLRADLEAGSAADLAARIGWGDVEHLAAALDGEPTSLALLSHLTRYYIVLPFTYFATLIGGSTDKA